MEIIKKIQEKLVLDAVYMKSGKISWKSKLSQLYIIQEYRRQIYNNLWIQLVYYISTSYISCIFQKKTWGTQSLGSIGKWQDILLSTPKENVDFG